MNIWNNLRYKVSYHAVYDKSIIDALNFAKKNNFSGIQVAVESPHLSFEHLSNDDILEIKKFCLTNGLYITLHGPDDISLFTINQNLRKGIFSYYKSLFKFAKEISARLVTIHIGSMTTFSTDTSQEITYPEEDLELYKESLETNLQTLFSFLDKDITLCIENYMLNKLILDVLQPFISKKKCWLCYDLPKIYNKKLEKRVELEKYFLYNKQSIKQVHLHDINISGKSHRIIGSGLLNFEKNLFELKDAPIIDYCIEVRPRDQALESMKNLKRILNKST
ncbi:MAG: TIM barrel protein [Promethearchaeota archaeon]